MRHVPEIKLIRTDTTLDLSQKAEKVCLGFGAGSHFKTAEAQFRSGRGAPQYLARENRAHVRFPGSGSQKQTGPRKNKKIKSEKKQFLVFFPNRKTRAESHALDATRHLDTLQYPVWNLSRLQMIHGSSNLALLCAPRECVWSWPEGYRNFNR